VEFDADDLAAHRGVLDKVIGLVGALDVVVVAFGVLGDQATAERDAAHALAVVHTDYTAHVGVLTELATVLRAQGRGTVVVFSSVAGVRVRRANYVYGSAKAGLDGFASGLGDCSGVLETAARDTPVIPPTDERPGASPVPAMQQVARPLANPSKPAFAEPYT